MAADCEASKPDGSDSLAYIKACCEVYSRAVSGGRNPHLGHLNKFIREMARENIHPGATLGG